jgi:hypothetical protein
MKTFRRSLLLFLCGFSFMSVSSVSAQEDTIQKLDSAFPRQYLLLGGGLHISDASLTQPAFSARFGYGRFFQPEWSAEAAFSFSGESSLYRMRMVGVGAAMSAQLGRSNAGDILVYFTPSESWKIGGGMQIRQTIYSSLWASYPFNSEAQVDHLFEFRLGALATLEHSFRVGEVNLGIRGNFAYFLPPFAGDALIGNESFVNFPATPEAIMTNAPFLSPRAYFSQLLQSLPFSFSLEAVAYIDF